LRRHDQVGTRTSALACSLALVATACDRGSCDEAALRSLVADPEPAAEGWQEQLRRDVAERKRVSMGIRAACPQMSSGWVSTMTERYESATQTADERAEVMDDRAREAGTLLGFFHDEERRSMMERACPGWAAVTEAIAAAPADRRAHLAWERCKFASSPLYPGVAPGHKPAVGERTPSHMFDFAVFEYLRAHGVSDTVAVNTVRRLGEVQPTDEPPWADLGESPPEAE
jgi:hypothetical protein